MTNSREDESGHAVTTTIVAPVVTSFFRADLLRPLKATFDLRVKSLCDQAKKRYERGSRKMEEFYELWILIEAFDEWTKAEKEYYKAPEGKERPRPFAPDEKSVCWHGELGIALTEHIGKIQANIDKFG